MLQFFQIISVYRKAESRRLPIYWERKNLLHRRKEINSPYHSKREFNLNPYQIYKGIRKSRGCKQQKYGHDQIPWNFSTLFKKAFCTYTGKGFQTHKVGGRHLKIDFRSVEILLSQMKLIFVKGSIFENVVHRQTNVNARPDFNNSRDVHLWDSSEYNFNSKVWVDWNLSTNLGMLR